MRLSGKLIVKGSFGSSLEYGIVSRMHQHQLISMVDIQPNIIVFNGISSTFVVFERSTVYTSLMRERKFPLFLLDNFQMGSVSILYVFRCALKTPNSQTCVPY